MQWRFRKLSSQQESISSIIATHVHRTTCLMILVPLLICWFYHFWNLPIGCCIACQCPPWHIFFWLSCKFNHFSCHCYHCYDCLLLLLSQEIGGMKMYSRVRFWWSKMCNNIRFTGRNQLTFRRSSCLFLQRRHLFFIFWAILSNQVEQLIEYDIVDNMLPRIISRIPLGGQQGGQGGNGGWVNDYWLQSYWFLYIDEESVV